MTIPSHTSQLFCTTIFGLCDYPAVTAETISFPSPKPVVNRPIPSTQDPIQIVHISDIHVDLSYEVGSSYNCTKNICCRPYTSAEAPGNNSYPAGPYGEHTCDSPASLEESLYNAIETIAPNAAFTMFTGDVVEGAVWLTTQIEVTNDLQNAYGKMSGLNLVYAAVENHDSNPVNSFPPAAVSTTLTNQWVYDTLSSLWETWIGTSAAAMADENPGAYSTVYPGNTTGKLRVISFDTNMYYKENFWLYETTMEQDPSGQLAWLVQELQAAEDAGERVYILGHMPMGSGDALHDGSNYFDQIINRYEATIAALFFGMPLFLSFLYQCHNYPSNLLLALMPLYLPKPRPHPQRRIRALLLKLRLPIPRHRLRNLIHRARSNPDLRQPRVPNLHRRPDHLRRPRHNNLRRQPLPPKLPNLQPHLE